MKNKIAFQVVILIAVTIVGVLIFKNKKSVAPQITSDDQVIDFSDPKSKLGLEEETTVYRAQNSANQKVVDVDLKKCASFLVYSSGNSLESAQQQIKTNIQFQSDELEMTEFQLRSATGDEIIVQNNSNEEKKDQVRVFTMAKDGLPDRVKDFPNANQSRELKLEGALTLGRLIKKIEKFRAVSDSGKEMFYEVEEGKTIRISLTEGKNQLLCEDLKCSCNQF